MSALLRTVAVAGAALFVLAATVAEPLTGVTLEDGSGRVWHLEELRGVPVLLVIADRRASEQANAWGERLAAQTEVLAPWRATNKVVWLAVADLRGVPDYARDAARARLQEREAGRSEGERRQASPLLLDWDGCLGASFEAPRAEAFVVLLSPEQRPLIRAHGAPTTEAVARVVEALTAAVPHSDRGASLRNVPNTRSKTENVAL